MIRTRKLWALLLALLTIASVAGGCSGAKSQNAPAAQTQPAAAAAAPTAPKYPLTITDDEGKSVTISQEPKHIVSLAPSNTELVFALGKGALLTGRTDFCDYPAEAKNVPSVGSLFPAPSYEKIVAAKPDLLLMMEGSAEIKKKIAADYQLPIITLAPKNMEQLYNDIKLLGTVLGAGPESDKLVADMQASVKAIADKTATATSKPSVFFEAGDDPLFTAGSATFMDTLITLAGGSNAAADVTDWAPYSMEKLVAHNPAFIIAQSADDANQLKAKKNWESVSAVKLGKVYGISDMNLLVRPGPRLVLGLKWLAETIHPELYGK